MSEKPAFPDERRVIRVWHHGELEHEASIAAGASWTAIEGTPLRARDDDHCIAVDVGALEPVDVLSGGALFVPQERPVLLGQHDILVMGPGASGTYALQFQYARELDVAGARRIGPLRRPRDTDGTRVDRSPFGDLTTQQDLGVDVAMPDGRHFFASLQPLTDDDVAAWVDGAHVPTPPRWPDRRGSAPAVGLGPAEAAAAAHFHGGRLPTEEEWDALAVAPGIAIGDAWEWTSTQRKGGGFVVRGGRYRDRRDVRGTLASRSWEDEGARDIVVRIVRDLSGRH